MTAVLSPPVRPGASYRHEAFFYRGDAEYLAGTLPMVREGLAAGEPVMVAVPPARLAQLRAALAAVAPDGVEQVRWIDMVELGRNPANILPAWSAFVEEHAGRRVRGIGEPVWPGRSDDDVQECQLHEALLNLAVSPDVPLWLRCPYDADALDEDVLRAAHLSHPLLSGPGSPWGSRTYAGASHAQELLATQLPDPPPGTDVLAVPFERRDLPGLRTVVRERASAAGLRGQRADDLVLAAHETALNSVLHGGGRGVLRLWTDRDRVVCEVLDAGSIPDPLVGRRTPPRKGDAERGVFLVNQLCDLVRLRTSAGGTTVRLVLRLG